MTEEEIKGLILFYVAGTLTPDQKKAVEDAFLRSPELKEELRFWEQARSATLLTAEERRHLTAEQIVDYAENLIEGERDKKAIGLHLLSCSSCRAELETIGGAMQHPKAASNDRPWVKDVIATLKGIRPSYAFAALAIMIVLFLVLNPHESKPPELASIPKQTDSTTHHVPIASPRRVVALTLMYQRITRGTAKTEPPTIALDSNATELSLTIQIPKSGIPGVAYSVVVSIHGDSTFMMDKALPKSVNAAFDAITLTVPTGRLRRPGLYAVVVMEKILERVREITPETYRYDFRVLLARP